jgi:hypothetical protein
VRATSDILIRIAAALAGVLFLRDGFAALRGNRLLITKGYSSIIFDGWKGRLMGALLIVLAVLFLGVAWFGL